MSPVSGSNKAGFVFGEADDKGPNQVLGVLPVETFLVQYTDGASKESVRLVFRAPGSKTAFILSEKISGSHITNPGTAWFNKALDKKLRQEGLSKAPNEGAEGAEAI